MYLSQHVIPRAQVWLLTFSLAVIFPSSAAAKRRPAAHVRRSAVGGDPWTEPTFADSTGSDRTTGEDQTVRRIAERSLGPYNGSVVIVDSSTGRVLSILNQKVALSIGYQPCSTFKVSVALAALSEKVIDPDPLVPTAETAMDLTGALAHSNNRYFANLGRELGFDKVSYYARQFGYGEKAGLDIAGEEAGQFPVMPPSDGGVARLTTFGKEISQTPLQLAALMSAVANGGTLFALQYPRTVQEAAAFTPRIKRKLSIEAPISGILPGLLGAVEIGTARGARQDEPIAGKTGTCSQEHTHLGWFGAFNNLGRRLVVVVLLRGGREATGPRAAAIAGRIYAQLDEANYLSDRIPAPPAVASARLPVLNGSLIGLLLLLCISAMLILVSRRSVV